MWFWKWVIQLLAGTGLIILFTLHLLHISSFLAWELSRPSLNPWKPREFHDAHQLREFRARH